MVDFRKLMGWSSLPTMLAAPIMGTDAADNPLTGTFNADNIQGLGGNDVIFAGGGDDLIYGQGDNDMILGQDGIDTLKGGWGNDTLAGGAGADILDGDGDGGDPTSSIDYASYQDAELGPVIASLDPRFANAGYAAAGDTYFNIEGLIGSKFNDALIGDAGNNYLLGGKGIDTLVGGGGEDYYSGEADGAFVSYEYASAAISLGFQTNLVSDTGEAAGDTYFGLLGIIGTAFNDTIAAGENIEVLGEAGDDTLISVSTNATMKGGFGEDTFIGGSGDDFLDGGEGADIAVYNGGYSEYIITARQNGSTTVEDTATRRDGVGSNADGLDTLTNVRFIQFSDRKIALTNSDTKALVISAVQMSETALATSIAATFSASDADGDNITYSLVDSDGPFRIDDGSLVLTGSLDFETKSQHSITVKATDGYGEGTTATFTLNVLDAIETTPFTLRGTPGVDSLIGEAGNDVLYGLAGNDVLKGEAGNDKLYGAAGKDILTGGTGQDIFVFDTKLSKSSKLNKANLDQIVDFAVPDDTIHLAKSVFKKLDKKGVLKSTEFSIGAEANDASDNLIYNKKTGALYYDADGTGAAAQIQIATLSKKLKLTYKDFFVV